MYIRLILETGIILSVFLPPRSRIAYTSAYILPSAVYAPFIEYQCIISKSFVYIIYNNNVRGN